MTAMREQSEPSRPAEPKRASRVADAIIADLGANGWPIGAVIGSEAELLERYDVSRAVFRESVRILEHLGVVTTRRGPGGGLVATEPSTAGVIQAFLVYLTYSNMSLGELMEARGSLERSIVRLASEHADEQHIDELRARVDAEERGEQLDAADHHVLHTMIGAAARNPAAELFIDVLGRLTARWSYPVLPATRRQEALETSARAHRVIVDAITAGNSALAEQRMATHLAALTMWLDHNQRRPRTLGWVLEGQADDEKLGSKVARSIIDDVVGQGWPIGAVLGSEPELVEKYDVSRAALREAVRLLEYHEVASMKRGPGGGLVVTAPSIDPIIRAATVFLEYRGITAADLIAMRVDLESDAVALATQRATDAQIAELRIVSDTNAAEGYEGPVENMLLARIAELTGNPAIAVFVKVLVHLTRVHAVVPGRRSPRRATINESNDHANRAIVDAIAGRDVALARRRVVKHLSALGPLLR